MKIKSAWIEYIINQSKKKKTDEQCWILTWRSSRLPGVVNWHGVIEEEQIKKLLSRKQFSDWKNGKRNSFIKHLTIQERKSILKDNNKENGR